MSEGGVQPGVDLSGLGPLTAELYQKSKGAEFGLTHN